VEGIYTPNSVIHIPTIYSLGLRTAGEYHVAACDKRGIEVGGQYQGASASLEYSK
jgi:hypothetical protein